MPRRRKSGRKGAAKKASTVSLEGDEAQDADISMDTQEDIKLEGGEGGGDDDNGEEDGIDNSNNNPEHETENGDQQAEAADVNTPQEEESDQQNETTVQDDEDDDEEEEEEEEEEEKVQAEDNKDENDEEFDIPRVPRRGRPARGRGRGRPPRSIAHEDSADERKRRRGRPSAASGGEGNEDDEQDGEEEEGEAGGVIVRRGRRPGRGGRAGRGRSTAQSNVHVDGDGNEIQVINSELALEEDAAGEQKVDKMGYLMGDREYRCRTFTVLGHGNQLFMLSTEPARCMSFRDSYLFFQKHKLLHKVIMDDDEKYDLIERNIIPHSYKGRTIGVVTARSVFREFGARIIVGGRRIIDDYYEARAIAEGAVRGEIAVPEDRLPSLGEKYNKNQYVAWHGASAVYHQYMPTPPAQRELFRGVDPLVQTRKRRIVVTDENWMLEHARAASQYNEALGQQRKRIWRDGIYEPHTGLIQFPEATQPSLFRWDNLEGIDGKQQHHSSSSSSTSMDDENDKVLEILRRDNNNNNNNDNNKVVVNGECKQQNGLVVGTVIQVPPIAMTGLKNVPKEVFADAPPEIVAAIRQQQEYEIEWSNNWNKKTVDRATAGVDED